MLKNKAKINKSINILDITNSRLYLCIKIGIAGEVTRMKSEGGTSGVRQDD